MPDSHAARYEGAFSGRRCLVTGGAGFIGSHLARRLVDLGAHVVVLDNLASGHQHNLPGEHLQSGRIELIEASILDEPALPAPSTPAPSSSTRPPWSACPRAWPSPASA